MKYKIKGSAIPLTGLEALLLSLLQNGPGGSYSAKLNAGLTAGAVCFTSPGIKLTVKISFVQADIEAGAGPDDLYTFDIQGVSPGNTYSH